jgi:hypothetical protein
MTALQGSSIVMVPLRTPVGKTRNVDLHIYDDIASVFFG